MSSNTKRALTICICLIVLFFPTAVAGAHTDENDPDHEHELDVDGGISSSGNETTVTLIGARRSSRTLVPDGPADISGTGPVATDGVSETSSGPGGTCIDWIPREYNAEEDFWYAAICRTYQICGSERVDDVIAGRIAGEDTGGRYRDYLNELTGLLAGDAYIEGTGGLDINSVNDLLVANGLSDPPSTASIPVFDWCANRSAGSTIWSAPLFTSTFGWGLDFEDVYDYPTSLANLFDELAANLDLYVPDVGLVPPAEQARTFVRWPTWMFLHNPLEEEAVYATNDPAIDTLRMDLRARLLRIEWSFGDTVVETCTADEMSIYTDTSDPIADLPECHHIFTQTGLADLTTTIYYQIEQKISTRLVSTDPYPDTAWTDYLNTPTVIELDTTIENYRIGEILSVNALPGQTSDDLRAALPTND